MKLLDQYIEAVGCKLSFKGREDIKAELKSLLLDDIESRFGSEPDEGQLKEVLKQFGSPAEVARRYSGHDAVIAPGLTSLYFLLIKVVLGGLSIAFFVVFILNMVTTAMGNNGPTPAGIDAMTVLGGLGQFISRTLSTWFGAVGIMTLVFMAITRYGKVDDLNIDAEWSPDELKDIELDQAQESRLESGITIGFVSVMLILVNVYPHITIAAEELFLRSGLTLGHRLVLEPFRMYMHLISVAWVLEIAGHVTRVFHGSKTKTARAFELAGNIGSSVVLLAMILNPHLYADYTNLIGFRLVFVIIAVITLAETGWLIVQQVIRALSRKG